MNRRFSFFIGPAACCGLTAVAWAFPPAPYHHLHGVVRDEQGRPLSTGEGTIHLLGQDSRQIVYAPTDAGVAPGENYRLPVPLDSAADARFYQVNALRPALPFTIRVVIDGVVYVPLEMTGTSWAMGRAAQDTRLDLTLGVDTDGDGLPDAWEQRLIDTDASGRLQSLADVKPEDDLDGDGLSNREEYLIGTYALDRRDTLELEVAAVHEGAVELRFTAITGRGYYLKASSDGTLWTRVPFALQPGGDPLDRWLANDLRQVSVFVPRGNTADTSATTLYRLYVD